MTHYYCYEYVQGFIAKCSLAAAMSSSFSIIVEVYKLKKQIRQRLYKLILCGFNWTILTDSLAHHYKHTLV